MRPRTLVILLAVVVGLGLFIAFYERKLPSSVERAERAKKALPVTKDEVLGVTLETASGTVSIERAPVPPAAKKEEKGEKGEKGEEEEKDEEAPPPVADWNLTKPLRTHADSFAVERLLDSLTNLEKTRTLDSVDRAAVGLDRPRATVRVKTKDGETVLLLGAEVPTGGSLIAGIKGEKEAYVVASTVLSEIDKPADDWRDKQLFRGSREAIERITLTSGTQGGAPVVLVQGPKGFEVQGPLRDRADRDAVEALLTDLTGLTAERFVSGRQPAEIGLAPPQDLVEVKARGGAPLRIGLGFDIYEAAPAGAPGEAGAGTSKLVYVQAGDALAEARTGLRTAAARTAEGWRSRSLSGFEVHQVESASVSEGGTPLELTRAGTDWKRGATTISYLPVSDLLFALSSARADRLLTPTEAAGLGAALAKPVLTFKLRSKEAGEETLSLYPPLAQGGVPAKASDRQAVLLLPAATLKQIQEKLAEVRTAKPAPPEKGS